MRSHSLGNPPTNPSLLKVVGREVGSFTLWWLFIEGIPLIDSAVATGGHYWIRGEREGELSVREEKDLGLVRRCLALGDHQRQAPSCKFSFLSHKLHSCSIESTLQVEIFST